MKNVQMRFLRWAWPIWPLWSSRPWLESTRIQMLEAFGLIEVSNKLNNAGLDRIIGKVKQKMNNVLEKNPGYSAMVSTAVGQSVACAPVTQRARVRSPVGTSCLGEVFSGFFLTCKTIVGKLQAPKVPEYHLAIIIITINHSLRTSMT